MRLKSKEGSQRAGGSRKEAHSETRAGQAPSERCDCLQGGPSTLRAGNTVGSGRRAGAQKTFVNKSYLTVLDG